MINGEDIYKKFFEDISEILYQMMDCVQVDYEIGAKIIDLRNEIRAEFSDFEEN